jgi:sialic acid synthase SpsE
MSLITIGRRKIGAEYPPYFIADIAANHDGDLNRAYKLIELAKESGADAAKFQNFKACRIVSDKGFRDLNQQLAHQKNWEKSVYEVYDEASIPDQWTPLLKRKCDEIGIEYMTSPYDFEAVDWAYGYVNCYKIGSGDITWHAILDYIAKKGKPVLLATGAACMNEVEIAVNLIAQSNPNIVLLQCNTNYTSAEENFKYINLRVLNTYREKYPNLILGLSDHTIGCATVLGAIALGASVIEKHFTDDNNRIGPDHKFSTTPEIWKSMVKAANELYYSLGNGIKKIEQNEIETSILQKRGLYLTKDLLKGEIIMPEHLIPLRPRSDAGFEPYAIQNIIGKRACSDLLKGSLLKEGDIS